MPCCSTGEPTDDGPTRRVAGVGSKVGRSGCVYLVGAGPGDPGLITVRGLQLLRRADVVVHDRLIPHELLAEVEAGAKMIDVGKVAGQPGRSQDEINAMLVEHARRGALVVRLKGGDPFLFGRGWEEMMACREGGIACVVVPGVSCAWAVPAVADVPLTLRKVSRSVAVVTAQNGEGNGAAALNYNALVGMDTVVVLMGRANLREVVNYFIAAGRDPATPTACVERGTMPEQRLVTGNLATIADLADQAQLKPPVTTVIGEVVRCAARWQGSMGPAKASVAREVGLCVEVAAAAQEDPTMIGALHDYLDQIKY